MGLSFCVALALDVEINLREAFFSKHKYPSALIISLGLACMRTYTLV